MYRQLSIVVLSVGVMVALATTPAMSDNESRAFVVEKCPTQMEELSKKADFHLTVQTLGKNQSAKTSFKDGDKMYFRFKSPQAGNIWVFNLDHEGQVTLLYPNKYEDKQWVKADHWYTVPSSKASQDGVQFTAKTEDKGTEYVFAVLATDRDDFLSDLKKLIGEDFPVVSSDSRDFIENQTRAFIVEKKDKPGKYGFGYQTVKVRPAE